MLLVINWRNIFDFLSRSMPCAKTLAGWQHWIQQITHGLERVVIYENEGTQVTKCYG